MAESPSRETFLSASTRTNRLWPHSWAASSASFKAIRSTSFQPSTYSPDSTTVASILLDSLSKLIFSHLVVLWHWSQGWALSPTLGGLKTAIPTITFPLHQPLQLLHPLAQALNLGFHLRDSNSSSTWTKIRFRALPAQAPAAGDEGTLSRRASSSLVFPRQLPPLWGVVCVVIHTFQLNFEPFETTAYG